jgi:uncharacterized protein YggU (UPF0235/DUF167 family)
MSSRAAAAGPFATTDRGLRVVVRLTPRAGRDALEGVVTRGDGAGAEVLKASVRAAPEDGAANQALIRLIAKSASVAPSRVRLERGAASRLKVILIEDAGPATAALLAKAN